MFFHKQDCFNNEKHRGLKQRQFEAKYSWILTQIKMYFLNLNTCSFLKDIRFFLIMNNFWSVSGGYSLFNNNIARTQFSDFKKDSFNTFFLFKQTLICVGFAVRATYRFVNICTFQITEIKNILDAKYLGFFSSCYFKTREKYISFAQLVFLSLYIF